MLNVTIPQIDGEYGLATRVRRKMVGMSKELTDAFKLSARSCPETFDAVERMRSVMARARGHKVPMERVVNWALQYVAGLAPAEMKAALAVGEGRLEGTDAGASGQGGGGHPGGLDVSVDPPSRRRRGKQG